jgi:signal transduction histidine kinase
MFAVTDTGCGISPENSEKIFNNFEKLDTFKQGVGLGLNLCRQIAKLLNGKIFLDTTYTGGARFVFIHPITSHS